LTQKEVRAATDMVADMLLMNKLNVHVLFDMGVTHSFIARNLLPRCN